jgi:biopolymer transport protein ExbB
METKTNVAPKPAAKAAAKKSSGFKGIKAAWIIIVICLIVAVAIFNLVFGNGANFQGGDNANQPVNILGTIFKGGFVVPAIWTCLFTVIVLSIERSLALRTAFGHSKLVNFVKEVRNALAANDLDKVTKVCDKQGGCVANVVLSTMASYKEMETTDRLTKEQKIINIQKTLDEATAIEMPALQENLAILATLTTLGVLLGLLGTVMGMIKSFSALSAGGGADSAALSTGISEALVNTASGIFTSALAVVMYNYFTNKIDKLTYSLDEVGFTIVQTFSATH